jgi:hypothetical protein
MDMRPRTLKLQGSTVHCGLGGGSKRGHKVARRREYYESTLSEQNGRLHSSG